MSASIPDRITGTVEILAALAVDASAEPPALAELVSTWVRAVEIGLFGPGRIRPQGVLETRGRRVSGRFECEQVSQTAFHVLLRMIRYFSKVKGQVDSFDVFHDGQQVVPAGGMTLLALPQPIPFAVEYPEDLKRYVRVEIEFRRPLTPNERDTIFDAFSVWSAMIEALGEEEWWGRRSDRQSRLLSLSIVEHEVNGYYASFECLYFIVWLGLRLHQRLIIERITME